MNSMPDAQLCHIGIYAFDLETMVDFYSRVFGLVVTDRGYSAGRGFELDTLAAIVLGGTVFEGGRGSAAATAP